MLNSRSGSPIVEIRCAVPHRRGSCAKPVGGAYATPDGIVIFVNRLKRRDSVHDYQRIARGRQERERAWEEGGFTVEEPVLVQLDGKWRVVPGADDKPTVRCPRHGAWTLDLKAVIDKVEEAQVLRAKQRYGTAPPS
jgi:hypothetical protein